MRKLYLAIILLCLSHAIYSQVPILQWAAKMQSTYPNPSNDYSNGRSVALDPQGNVYSVGIFFPYSSTVNLFGYRMSSGNIYVFCNFRINSNNQCERQQSGATLIRFNGYTGEIIDQTSDLPLDDANNVVSGMYNFALY